MSEVAIHIQPNLEITEPRASPSGRNSTGNYPGIQISEARDIPNYLRASTGSCHDICKYGVRLVPLAKKQDRKSSIEPETFVKIKVKRVVESTKLRSVSAKKQPKLNLRPSGPNNLDHQSPAEQPKRPFLRKSSKTQSIRIDEGKDIRTCSVSRKSGFVPLSSSRGSSVKVSIPKSRNSKSFVEKSSTLQNKNWVKKSETDQKTSYEDVPEKIIHVIEPKEESRSEVLAQKEHILDSAAHNRRRATRDRREFDSSSRKLKFRRGKVLEVPKGNGCSIELRSLSRPVFDGEVTHEKNNSFRGVLRRRTTVRNKSTPCLLNYVIEETASKLVKVRKSKVMALVGAFERVIDLQESDSLRTSLTAL